MKLSQAPTLVCGRTDNPDIMRHGHDIPTTIGKPTGVDNVATTGMPAQGSRPKHDPNLLDNYSPAGHTMPRTTRQ